MRIYEVKDETARMQTITEYIEHIGFEEFYKAVQSGEFWDDMEQWTEAAVWYEGGGITPADNAYDLADELERVLKEHDYHGIKWISTCIENGMHYLEDIGEEANDMYEFLAQLGDKLVGFDDDGKVLLIG